MEREVGGGEISSYNLKKKKTFQFIISNGGGKDNPQDFPIAEERVSEGEEHFCSYRGKEFSHFTERGGTIED